jgi:uncharacterized protein DUF6980
MDCDEFRRRAEDFTRLPLPQEVWDTPEFSDWISHRTRCSECSDLLLRREVESRGARVDDFPCVHLAWQATFHCDQHPDLHDCSKVAILYLPRFDEWSLRAVDDADHVTQILYCPWCGMRLPDSKRDLWFETLAVMGYNAPAVEEVPLEFR